MAAAAPLHADRGQGRANVANRDRGRDYSRRAHPSDTPGRITDGHLSPKPIPTILSDATRCCVGQVLLTTLTGPGKGAVRNTAKWQPTSRVKALWRQQLSLLMEQHRCLKPNRVT